MTRLIALVQLAHEEPTLCVLRASGGFAIPPFRPRPADPGRPWGRVEFDPDRLRTPDADVTLERMGLTAPSPWEQGPNGQWSAGVEQTDSLPELAAVTSEPVSVSLNTARLFEGHFRRLPASPQLVGTRHVEAVSHLVRDMSFYAELWEAEARSCLRRLNPALRVALNAMVMPWDPPAVSLPNTAPDDGPLPWYVWSTATRLTPQPAFPALLQ